MNRQHNFLKEGNINSLYLPGCCVSKCIKCRFPRNSLGLPLSADSVSVSLSVSVSVSVSAVESSAAQFSLLVKSHDHISFCSLCARTGVGSAQRSGPAEYWHGSKGWIRTAQTVEP